jgi:hypothetical protein
MYRSVKKPRSTKLLRDFVGRVVGFKVLPPAAGDEDDREFFTRVWL